MSSNGNIFSIELYYGDLTFDIDFVKSAIANWGDDSILTDVNTDGVYIAFSSDGKLIAEDLDGCGIMWSLDDFKTYTNI